MTGPAYTHITIPVPVVGEFMFPPEPPEGSTVQDRDGDQWIRSDGWRVEDSGSPLDWELLCRAYGPLVLERWGQ